MTMQHLRPFAAPAAVDRRGEERAAGVAAVAYAAGASLAEAMEEAAAFMRAWNAHPSHKR